MRAAPVCVLARLRVHAAHLRVPLHMLSHVALRQAHNNPAELEKMRRERDANESAAEKAARDEAYKQAVRERALAEQEARARKAMEVETLYGMQVGACQWSPRADSASRTLGGKTSSSV